MSNVVVYIVAQQPDTFSERIVTLQNIFMSYTVLVRYIPPNINITPSSTMTATDQIQAYQFITILKESALNYPDYYTVFIFESSITATNNIILDNVINQSIELNKDSLWDILYLTHWYTDCYNQNPDFSYNIIGSDINIQITQTVNTLGFQSYLISPNGRNMLLGLTEMNNGFIFPPIIYPVDKQILYAIQSGGLKVFITYPNIFEYDTSFNLSEYNNNVYKTWTCLTRENTTTNTNVNFTPFLIAVGVFILLCLLFWALYRIGPTSTGPKNSNCNKPNDKS